MFFFSLLPVSGSNIPVGIAVARQRCQRHNEIKISSNSVPPPVVHKAVQSSASIDLSSTVGTYRWRERGGLFKLMTSCFQRKMRFELLIDVPQTRDALGDAPVL